MQEYAEQPEAALVPATPFRPAGNPLRDKVVATADAYPDVAVKVLRNWIRNA
jgi:hypothetical protein